MKGYAETEEWKTCTQSKCPILTSCIFRCETDECLLGCISDFKKEHQFCPCEVVKIL